MIEKQEKGTLLEYREKAKCNQDIAKLIDMIDKLQIQLNKALEALKKNESF